MALVFSRMAAAADGFSSDGGLLKDASESELVGMDDRLDVEGNWLRMFPVSSLIWAGRGSLIRYDPGGCGANERRITVKENTWKKRMMFQMRPRMMEEFPSAMSAASMLTSLT